MGSGIGFLIPLHCIVVIDSSYISARIAEALQAFSFPGFHRFGTDSRLTCAAGGSYNAAAVVQNCKKESNLIPGNSMSFTQNQLLPGEQLILLARQHVLVLFRPFLLNLAALILLIGIALYTERCWLLAFFLIPLLYFAWEYLAWRSREYILTSRRVVRQEGVISVSSLDAPLDKINNVSHSQTLMGRLLKYGHVGLETASEQGTTEFEFLATPVNF